MEKLFLEPKEISEKLVNIGIKKAESNIFELFFFGILAGIYIGFGAQCALVIMSGGTLDQGFAKFLAGSVFSVGLMLVLIPGAELFTGNLLMTIGCFKKKYNILKLLKNWLIVYIGNFVGSVFLAYMILKTGLNGNLSTGLTPLGQITVKVAEVKMNLSFNEAFFRGILCNILVCLAVIISVSSLTVTGKILGIYFPIMTFVACGYEHSIANMFLLPVGLMLKGTFISEFVYIWKNLIPVTLGNIVGGIIVVLFHPKMIKKLIRAPSSESPH